MQTHIHIQTLPEALLDSSLVKGVSFHPASVLGLFEAKGARVFDGDLPSSSSLLSFHGNFCALMCLPPPLSASCHPSCLYFFPHLHPKGSILSRWRWWKCIIMYLCSPEDWAELVKTAGAPFYLNNIVKSSSLRTRKTHHWLLQLELISLMLVQQYLFFLWFWNKDVIWLKITNQCIYRYA